MSDFEVYSKELLEASKELLQTAKNFESDNFNYQLYLRSSLFHGFCFLEAQINYICGHFNDSTLFDTLGKSILVEQDIELKNGKWKLSGRTKFYGLKQRIEFIVANFINDIEKELHE